jgi:type I restriction enzyme S subunit
MATSQDFVNWVCTSRIDHAFLKYILLAEKDSFLTFASGTTHQTIYFPEVKAFHVCLPPPSTQRKIAAILSAYDVLIENNERRIKILEEMAQRIYHEWFVEFRYPGHENMPLEHSDLGLIPQGWMSSTLGVIAKWSSGGTPRTSTPEYWNGHIPWISSGVLTHFLINRSDRYVTDAGAHSGTRLVERDTVLLIVRGMSLAKEVRMGIAERTVAFSQDCKALEANEGVEPLYLAFTMRELSERLLGMVEYAAHGTGLLATDRVQSIGVVIPTEDLQLKYVEHAGYIRLEIANLTSQVESLRTSRDLLLPRLISGDVDVSDLDVAMGEDAA